MHATLSIYIILLLGNNTTKATIWSALGLSQVENGHAHTIPS